MRYWSEEDASREGRRDAEQHRSYDHDRYDRYGSDDQRAYTKAYDETRYEQRREQERHEEREAEERAEQRRIEARRIEAQQEIDMDEAEYYSRQQEPEPEEQPNEQGESTPSSLC